MFIFSFFFVFVNVGLSLSGSRPLPSALSLLILSALRSSVVIVSSQQYLREHCEHALELPVI